MSRKLQSLLKFFCSAFLITTLITGCASRPPKYDVYPTLSLSERVKDKDDWWTILFNKELNILSANEWTPKNKLFDETFSQVVKEYGVSTKRPAPSAVKQAFRDFKFEDYSSQDIKHSINGMLQFIDHEHPNLLLNAARHKSAPLIDTYKLPSLVSSEYPVGVSLTKWTTPIPLENKPAKSSIIIIPNTVIVSADKSQITSADGKVVFGKEGKEKDDSTKKDGKEGAKTSEENKLIIDDFNPEQNINLSLSTVLNSPSVLDRIEYVSTYIKLEPFPFPPNGDVVLEREFWRRFFALNTTRDGLIKDEATSHDMRRAIEDMRVRIINTDTTVKIRDLDFGSLKQSTKDNLNAEIGATIAAVPTLTGLNPKLTYAKEVYGEQNLKLQQQLDQRSAYVDPSGSFLRVTQRGMQSVNLAGRFVENVTLHIPVAQDEVQVLVPSDEKATKYVVRWFSEPLYSRVDALTMSVVVARQATALAESTKDSFRLDDPKDAAYIVGVTRPYRFTVWQNEREMSQVMTREIFGNDINVQENSVVFFTFEQERPAPLRLYKFTPDQQHELLAKIREQAIPEYGVVSLTLDGCRSVKIGLRDREDPSKLVGFKK